MINVCRPPPLRLCCPTCWQSVSLWICPTGFGTFTVCWIDLQLYDIGSRVEGVVVDGESGYDARPCYYDWVLAIRDLCVKNNVSFWFKQTGANFVKDGRLYHIRRQLQHSQARKAGISFQPEKDMPHQ